MATTTQRPVTLRLGEFQVEYIGVEWPDYFQGYGLGPSSRYAYCAYGIGNTEEEALADCLEMVAQQGFDVDGETEERIRAEYGPADDSETALEALGVEEETDESPFFHVGIKWSCREEERLARIRKIADLEFLRYQDYRPQGPSALYSARQEWGYTRRIDPDSKSVSYGDVMDPDNCPASAVKYLEGLSTDPTEHGELYFFLPYATGSDYSGSTVEKANHKAFLESHGEEGFVWDAHGGFDTYAVVLGLTGLLECPDDTFDAVMGVVEGLKDYPLIDEEALSELEMELADEAWECWGGYEFRKALEAKFDGTDFDWPDGSDFRSFFEQKREEANEYWESESCGPSVFVRIERVVEKIDFADVAQWVVK